MVTGGYLPYRSHRNNVVEIQRPIGGATISHVRFSAEPYPSPYVQTAEIMLSAAANEGTIGLSGEEV